MSNETVKPLAGVLRAVRKAAGVLGDSCLLCTRGRTCPVCAEEARIIARESGLAELVAAVEQADTAPLKVPGGNALGIVIDPNHWAAIVAAARRVKEG